MIKFTTCAKEKMREVVLKDAINIHLKISKDCGLKPKEECFADIDGGHMAADTCPTYGRNFADIDAISYIKDARYIKYFYSIISIILPFLSSLSRKGFFFSILRNWWPFLGNPVVYK